MFRVVFIVSILTLTLTTRDAGAERKRLSAEQKRAAAYSMKEMAATRRIESLAGMKLKTRDEVEKELMRLPYNPAVSPRSVYQQQAEQMDVSQRRVKVVRTGSRKVGDDLQAKGYIVSEYVDPFSKDNVTVVEGTDYACVRRRNGADEAVVIMRYGAQVAEQASTIDRRFIRNLFGLKFQRNASRKSIVTDRGNGNSQVQVVTKRSADDEEIYKILRQGDGALSEHLVQTHQGQTTETKKVGKLNDDQLVAKYKQPGQQTHTVFPGDQWQWQEQFVTKEGSTGTIVAYGRGSKMFHVKSGYMSPLGTAYGEIVEQRSDGLAQQPTASMQPLQTKVSKFSPAKVERSKMPELRESEPTEDDRARLQRAAELYAMANGKPIDILITPDATYCGAWANPFDAQKNMTEVGYLIAKSTLATQVLVLGHEAGHEDDAAMLTNDHRMKLHRRTTYAHLTGNRLETQTAHLVEMDRNRLFEKRADRASGVTLGKVKALTGDEQISPEDGIQFLQGGPVAPEDDGWTPHDGYPNLKERRDTIEESFQKTLKTALQPAPAQ